MEITSSYWKLKLKRGAKSIALTVKCDHLTLQNESKFRGFNFLTWYEICKEGRSLQYVKNEITQLVIQFLKVYWWKIIVTLESFFGPYFLRWAFTFECLFSNMGIRFQCNYTEKMRFYQIQILPNTDHKWEYTVTCPTHQIFTCSKVKQGMKQVQS